MTELPYPAVRKVPDMDWAQHKVFWVLSVIEEEPLKNFFRAVRKGAVRPILVDEVNAELDKGIGIAEMFRSSPAIQKITDNTCIEFQVEWFGAEPLLCSIQLGHMRFAGSGAQWHVRFDPQGQVVSLELEEVWGSDIKDKEAA